MRSHGVYMNMEALARHNALGYGELTGFETTAYHDMDCMERFGNHPLNPAGCEERVRNCRQAFYPGTATGTARRLSYAETRTDGRLSFRLPHLDVWDMTPVIV